MLKQTSWRRYKNIITGVKFGWFWLRNLWEEFPTTTFTRALEPGWWLERGLWVSIFPFETPKSIKQEGILSGLQQHPLKCSPIFIFRFKVVSDGNAQESWTVDYRTIYIADELKFDFFANSCLMPVWGVDVFSNLLVTQVKRTSFSRSLSFDFITH